MDIDWTKFQDIQDQIKTLEAQAKQECIDNGLKEAIGKAMSEKDVDKAEMIILDMPDSIEKRYIHRRICQMDLELKGGTQCLPL